MQAVWRLNIQLIALLWLNVACSFASPLQEPPFELPAPQEVNKLRSAIIYTDLGEIHLELFPKDAPWHVTNLKYLADKGFYKNVSFHIYEPGYLVQGGDQTGTGRGGARYSLPAEFNQILHKEGTVGMARVQGIANPERRSHGSQFYIILGRAPHMDGLYTAFGRVTKGMDIVHQLRRGDVIRDLRVFVRK